MVYIVNFGSAKTPIISEVISSLGYTNQIFDWHNVAQSSFNKAKGIILSGSPTFLTEVDHVPYVNNFIFLKKTDVPVLGICFGHQVLGILYGAKIFRGKEIRSSNNINILKEDILFEKLKNPTRMIEDHTEGINLPEDFIHLASSDSYENEAMKHIKKNIYGIQFHPEVSGENGKILMNNFCQLC